MNNVVELGRIVLAAAAFAVGAASFAAAQPARVTIGTGPAGTLYNQIGTAVSAAIQDKLGIPATARPFGGTSQYLPLLHRGDITMGINSALDANEAFMGKGAYNQPLSDVRALTLIARSPYGFYARSGSGLESVADLAGKSVVMEYRSIVSFNQVNAAVLATADLSADDVKAEAVAGIPDAVRSLVEGRVDALGVIVGIPLLREADASVDGGLRLLNIGEDEGALDSVAGFEAVTLEPGPAYVGIAGPTRAARFDTFLNVGTSLGDDDAYALAKTIYESWGDIQKNLPALRSVAQKDLASLKFEHPYHPGAVRLFKEVGLWTDEHQKKQDALLGG